MSNFRDVATDRPAAEQRGASVPFEGPDLLGAKVRPDRQHDLVALLHDFAGNGATYVLPWPIVPETLAMSAPDRALHTEIWRLRAATPAAVEGAVRGVAASGAAGAEARGLEEARRQHEEERRTEILGRFASRLFQGLGLGRHALEACAGRRAQFEAACARHEIHPDALIGTLEECATLILPVGLAQRSGHALAGPQRVLAGEVARFARHLQLRAKKSRDEAARYASVEASARQAAEQAGKLLRRIDGIVHALLPTIAKWSAARSALAADVDGLGWVLDGWEDALAYHVGALATPPTAAARKATVLASIAPRQPAAP